MILTYDLFHKDLATRMSEHEETELLGLIVILAYDLFHKDLATHVGKHEETELLGLIVIHTYDLFQKDLATRLSEHEETELLELMTVIYTCVRLVARRKKAWNQLPGMVDTKITSPEMSAIVNITYRPHMVTVGTRTDLYSLEPYKTRSVSPYVCVCIWCGREGRGVYM